MNYLLIGNENFLLKKQLKELLKECKSEMDVYFYDALSNDFSISQVLDDCNMPPFFSDKKVVIIQNPIFLSALKSLSDTEVVELDKYLKKSSLDTDLIFYGDISLDKRKKIVKSIQNNCRVYQFDKLSVQDFNTYVMQQSQKNKLTFSTDAKNELFYRLPNDLESFHSELEKMCLYGKHFEKEDIIHLVSRPLDEDVFHLVNAVVNRNIKQALHLWEDLYVLNKDPIYLVALLASQFRLLYQVRVYLDQGMNERMIQQHLPVHPYRVTKSIESLKDLSAQRCLAILNSLAELDQSFKMGLIDKKVGFELFLIRIAR